MVLFPVIKAEHGGHPVGITGIQGPGKGQHIGDDGDCGNAVLPTYLSIVQLNISVMMPLTSAVAISEQPFVTALPSVWGGRPA